MKKIDVVVAGHICVDMIPKFRKTSAKTLNEILLPGKLVNVDDMAISTGGPVSNTGIALQKLGTKVEFMAKIGDDFLGRVILERLRGVAGIKGMKIVKGEGSSYTIAIAPPGIDRVFLHCPGTNDTFGYEDINFDIVKNAKIFHLGYPPLMRKLYSNYEEELVKIFKKAKSLGVTTSLDLSLPDPDSESGKTDWDTILKKVLPYVDIFLPSFEEICFMLDRKRYDKLKAQAGSGSIIDYLKMSDLTDLARKSAGYGAKIIGFKCSHRGFYGMQENKELFAPAFYVENIASATGSGDSAIAGFLKAFLDAKDMGVTLRCANAAGAFNLRAYDAISGIESWEEILELFENKGAKLNEIKIGEPGWKHNNVEKIWEKKNESSGI